VALQGLPDLKVLPVQKVIQVLQERKDLKEIRVQEGLPVQPVLQVHKDLRVIPVLQGHKGLPVQMVGLLTM
jgi:hypothetical protein